MPWTYRHASREWAAFLADVKDRSGLVSDNMAYTAVEGVLRAFRRRLTVAEGLAFADLLPAVPRAIFVADWVPSGAPVPFDARAAMTGEVQAHRRHHNIAPDDIIEAVAWALRRSVPVRDFDHVMDKLPEGARTFWHVEVDNPAELGPRIV